MWIAHHHLLSYLAPYLNRPLRVINSLTLFFIALLPFSCSLTVNFQDPAAARFAAFITLFAGSSLAATFLYARVFNRGQVTLTLARGLP